MFVQSLFDLRGRVAIVTGASSGLGERFARVLSASGASVVVAARRIERIERLAAELGNAVPVACDVTDDADRAALVGTALERFGRIDVLVNNAGITHVGRAEIESSETWHRVVDVNLNAPYLLSREVFPYMKANGRGSIVNIASILGVVASSPIPNASYCASKGGLVNLTRELGCQWARTGVRVNCIAPGWFPSEMTAADMLADEQSMAFLERNCPLGRPGAIDELDGALLFLASDASTYCIGQTLAVDGGWTAR